MRSHGPLIVVITGVLLAAALLAGFVWAASEGEPDLGEAIVVSPSDAGPERTTVPDGASPTPAPSGEPASGGASATAAPTDAPPTPRPSATPTATRSRAEPVKPPPPRQGAAAVTTTTTTMTMTMMMTTTDRRCACG